MKQIDLYVQNLDCEHDAARLQRALAALKGADVVRVFPSAAKVRVTIDENTISHERLEAHLSAAGFPVVRDRGATGLPPLWRNAKVLASITSARNQLT